MYNNLLYLLKEIDGANEDKMIAVYNGYCFIIQELLKKNISEVPKEDVCKAIISLYKGNDKNEDIIEIYYKIYIIFDSLNKKEILEVLDIVRWKEPKIGANITIPNAILETMLDIKKDNSDILLIEIEKFGSYLYDFIKNNQKNNFSISCKNENNISFYRMIFDFNNVSFLYGKIDDEKFTTMKYDYIISFPPIGVKNKNNKGLISSDVSLAYAQSLLYRLKNDGALRIILPAKVGFAGNDVNDFREFIGSNYKINSIYLLTSNVFKPYMSINTYYMEFTTGKTENIYIKKIDKNKNGDIIEEFEKLVLKEEFEELNDWNIESLLVEKSNDMIRYEKSNIKKLTIKEIGHVLKGKTITKKNIDGNIKVINIGNIINGAIDYSNLESIEDDEIKNARYILEDEDIIISARGTVIKIGLFEKQNYKCIASSNLNIIRCNKEIINSMYLKLFLESNVGKEIINSIRRGSIVLNINYKDLELLKVPVPSMDLQKSIIKEYENGKKVYENKINAAENEWNEIKNDIDNKLY